MSLNVGPASDRAIQPISGIRPVAGTEHQSRWDQFVCFRVHNLNFERPGCRSQCSRNKNPLPGDDQTDEKLARQHEVSVLGPQWLGRFERSAADCPAKMGSMIDEMGYMKRHEILRR